MSLAVEGRLPLRDLVWASQEHPALIDTLHGYLEWRAAEQQRNQGR